MARVAPDHDLTPTLAAAERWITTCLIEDGSIFTEKPLWAAPLVDEVYHAFADHPDLGADDFMTKLKGQIGAASHTAQQLAAEMLWVLLLFPTNMKASSKRRQIAELWAMAGQGLPDSHPMMLDAVLFGIGSGGPA
jgi:5-methylcytosine-specific restriction enzyme B